MAEKTTSEFSLIIINLQLSHSVFLAIVKHKMYTQMLTLNLWIGVLKATEGSNTLKQDQMRLEIFTNLT